LAIKADGHLAGFWQGQAGIFGEDDLAAAAAMPVAQAPTYRAGRLHGEPQAWRWADADLERFWAGPGGEGKLAFSELNHFLRNYSCGVASAPAVR
jgi:hypothetical protein